MSNIEKDIKKLPKMFNDIGLYGDTDICRLIGFADSGEDYYYIIMKTGFKWETPKIIYASMVGAFVSLKRHYKRYKQLDNQMTSVWNCPPQKEWRNEIIKE